MTITRILPLAALATTLAFASQAGAQVTTSGTQQDTSKAPTTTSAGSGSMTNPTPANPTPTTTPAVPAPTPSQDLNATTPPATPNPPATTTNPGNMSGQDMNAPTSNGMATGSCASANASPDCTSGLVHPTNVNGDVNAGRRHMRVGKDVNPDTNGTTGTTGTSGI